MKKLIIIAALALTFVNGLNSMKSAFAEKVTNRIQQIELASK